MRKSEVPDTLFLNGKVVTLAADNPIVSAVAVKGGRIMAVGSDDEIKGISGDDTEIVDLNGKTMLPGLIDSHCHFGLATRSFIHWVDGRCPPNKSIPDILERIRQRAEQTSNDEPIFVHGSMFGNYKLAENRYPTKEEFDSAAPEHPVVFFASMHQVITNSATIKMARIEDDTDILPGGVHIERDKETGKPTGVFKEGSPIGIPSLPYDQLKETLKEGITKYWLPQGITSAYSFTTDGNELRAYQEMLDEGSLPLRVKAMFCELSNSPRSLESLVYLGIKPNLGNERLSLGGMKIFVDGAFMTLTAASREPYLNIPGDEDYRGVIRMDHDTLSELVHKAHNAGLTLCVHAMGDKAQEYALDAYERALTENPREHRHRIEHFGCDMSGPDLREKAKKLGIIGNVTSGWLHSYGDFIEKHLGAERSKQSFAWRTMIDEGFMLADSSDQCGTDPLTLNPFHSMWCAVTRQTYFGNKFLPEEAITVEEALRMWTVNGAYSGGEEDIKGSIEPGKLADMIVISDDILTIPEDNIRDIKVDMTIIDGQTVYKR